MAGKVVSYVLRGEITQFTASMRAAAASTAKLADDLTGLDAKGAKMRQGMTTIGDAAGKMGLAAAAGLGLVVKAAMDWESAWAGVQKTVDGSASEMATLEGELRGLAKTLPATHAEIAAVAEAAGQLGIERESVAAFTRTMIDLGETTNLTADEAATSIARFTNIMGTSADEVSNIGSALVELGNNSATTEAEIMEFGTRLAAAGAIAGLSEGDVLGFAAAMSSVGVEAEAGGTALSKVFTSMRDAAIDGGAKLETFAATAGMTAQEFTAAWSQDPAQVINAFVMGLGDINAAGESTSAVFKSLGLTDQRLMKALLSAAEAGELLGQSLNLGNTGFADNTALAIEAAKRYETTASQVQVAWNAVKDSAIDFGEAALPVLAKAAEGAANFAQAVGKIPDPAKNAAAGLLGITAVLGGGLWFTSKVLNGVADMRAALENVGMSGEKASKAMKGIGIAAAALGSITVIDSLQRQVEETLPGMEALTRQLIDLANAGAGAKLSAEFDSLGDSLDRMFAKNAAQKLEDFLGSKIGVSDSRLDEAKAEVEALDTALANLVATGNADLASDALENLIAVQGLSAEQAQALRDALGQYNEALIGTENSADLAAGGQDQLTDAITGTARAAEEEAAALQESIDAMRDARAEAIRGANAQINYEASLDDARKSLKENGRTLDITTEKGRANRRALLDMASAWNDQDAAVKNGRGARAAAIQQFVDMAAKMGMGREKARELARSLYEIPEKRSVDVNVNTGQATSELVRVQGLLNAIPRTVAVSIVAQRRGDWSGSGPGLASGGTVDGPRQPYGDKVLTMLAPGEEVISNRYGQADRHRDLLKAINAGRYADGGTVQRLAEGGTALPKDPERRADVLRLLIEIRDLRKDLAKTGKDALSGLERRRTEAELQATLRDLRETRGAGRAARRDALQERYDSIMAAMSGFDVSGALGRTNDPKNPTAAGVRSEIAEMRDALKEAGVAWSKEMRENARRMVRQARAIDVHERALERETKRREELTETLAEQQQAMEQLQQAMGSFSQQVAGNFLPDTFKGAYTVTEPGRVDPALQGRLSAAEQRLIALRSSPTGDSVAAAAEASRLLPQIEAMRAEIEQQSQPVERTVSALEAMREELAKNAEDATAFAEALRSLSASGLDPALFAELAASGDLGLAQELVKGGPAAVEDINDLWNQRAAAAAEVAAFATQQVYGEQQAALQKQIDAQSKLISAADKTIKALEGEVKVLGDRVERGAERGVKHVEQRLASIESAIKSLPRETRDNQRAGKGRG